MKIPFCKLPIDAKSLSHHAKLEVPFADMEQANPPKQKQPKTNTQGLNVGATGSINLAGGTSSYMDKDDSMKDSSSLSNTNSKLMKQTTKKNVTTTQIDQKKVKSQLEESEAKNLADAIDKASLLPSDLELQIMTKPKLKEEFTFVERILNQNSFHKQYISYRNYPEVKIEKTALEEDQIKKIGFRTAFRARKVSDEGFNSHSEEEAEENKAEKSPLEFLFNYSCDLTKNRTVSSAHWNPINSDLLAVSYGEYDLQVKNQGYLMFWTLKNPRYPERIITRDDSKALYSGILSCKFSENNPHLIAVGTYNGVVAVYDIRKKEDKPVVDNFENDQKHTDAVWEVQWIPRGSEKGGEDLISISSDGRIVEWSMKKGKESNVLMNLKKQNNPSEKDGNEGMNFRAAAGFSFDFLQGETNMYLASTEEGTVHRCSKSYVDQYLDNYIGHTGSVYKIGPPNSGIGEKKLILTLSWFANLIQSQDLFDEVIDISWSPQCSTLFSLVCKDGRIEIWDLKKKNMLDPFAFIKPSEDHYIAPKTMIRFSDHSPVLISGDSMGDVNVYRLFGYEDIDPTPKVQRDSLLKVLYPGGYNKGQKEEERD